MKAIVTGGAGFIGRHLTDRLTSEGWEVLVIDDFSTHRNHADAVLPERERDGKVVVHFQQGSVQDVIIPRQFNYDGIDAVFHLAGKLGPVGVLHYKGYIAIDTIEAADRAADWAENFQCPMIDISTSEVYGSPDEANSEDTFKVFRNFTARSEYAISKLAAENMLVNRQDLDVRIIRPFNVTGPGQRPEGGFVIPRFVRQALDKDILTVYHPGTQRRSFTHVDDVVDGIMLAFYAGRPSEVYNIGNPNNTRSMLDIAQMVVNQVGSGKIEVVDPRDLHGPNFFEAPEKIPNADKAMRELGFAPYRPIEQIIQDAIDWERQIGKSTGIRIPDTQ